MDTPESNPAEAPEQQPGAPASESGGGGGASRAPGMLSPLMHTLQTHPATAFAMVATVWVLGMAWPTLSLYFSTDDLRWLDLALLQTPSDWFYPQGRPTPGFRPVSGWLFFRANYELFGMSPLLFRLELLGLWVGSATLAFAIIRRLGAATVPAAFAALITLCNPALFRDYAWIATIAEMGMTFCFLAAFGCFLRADESASPKWTALAWGATVVGLLCKETMVVLAPVLWLYDAVGERRKPPEQTWWRSGLRALRKRAAWYALMIAALAGHLAFNLAFQRAGQTAYALDFHPDRLAGALSAIGAWSGFADFADQWDGTPSTPGALFLVGAIILVAMALRRGSRPAGVYAPLAFVAFVLTITPFVGLSTHLYGYYLILPLFWLYGGLALALWSLAVNSRIARQAVIATLSLALIGATVQGIRGRNALMETSYIVDYSRRIESIHDSLKQVMPHPPPGATLVFVSSLGRGPFDPRVMGVRALYGDASITPVMAEQMIVPTSNGLYVDRDAIQEWSKPGTVILLEQNGRVQNITSAVLASSP